MSPRATPQRLVFVLVPQFSMMAFASAIEPLRAANRLAGTTLFEWQLASVDGSPVLASNGITLAVDAALDVVATPEMVVLCVALDPLQCEADRRLRHGLRALAGRGCHVGGISAATFALADAGLLEGRRCTIHWEYAEAFRVRYPAIELVDELFVIDGPVFTCSGGVAALDLMLHFIRERAGRQLAVAVADQFIHPLIRIHSDHQRLDLRARHPSASPRLLEILAVMEAAKLDAPPSLGSLARRCGISPRHMERLFREELGTTPREFLLRLRLERGRVLLTTTATPIRDVALETGFSSPSHFSHSYRRAFGLTPREARAGAGPARP